MRAIVRLLLVACLIATSLDAFSETSVRRSAWTFGLRSISYDYESATASKVKGVGGAVDFGYGYIGDNWYGYGLFSSLSGPFDRIRRDRVSLDFNGTGVSSVIGFAPFQNNIRSGTISYSVITGFSANDVAGRSVGNVDINDEQLVAADDAGDEGPTVNRRIRSYTMQVNEFCIVAGLGLTWLAPVRTIGNSPEMLRTKLDGVLATFGASVPVSARHKSRFEQSLAEGPYEVRKVKGRLSGVSYFFALTTLIGV